MIASWMLYALLVSVLVAAGAWLLEEGVRQRGGPVRVLWLGALLATVALVAMAPLRTGAPAVMPVSVTEGTPSAGAAQVRREGVLAAAAQALRAARDAVAHPLEAAAQLGAGRAGTALGLGWMALSAAALGLIAVTALRARRARRTWPVAEMADARVRVAPRTGPAVLGILHPEVVVPSWLLAAPEHEQRLVVLHEREHVRARDPLVLAVGCLAAALVPWSPAAWWMLLRLRAAVELDCDARVLRRGVARHAYGSLLIEMAGRGPGLTLGAPALAGSPSTLERRLRAMNVRLPRSARLRAGLLGTLGLALLAGACESPLPTSAEVQRMDVNAVEARANRLQMPDGERTYFVDGRQVTAEAARAIPADQIARVDVSREGDSGTVTIYTRAYDMSHAPAGGATAEGGNRVQFSMTAPEGGAARPGGDFDGLLVVDGVVTDASALRTINPDRIERIDVLKGDAATREYTDPRAAKGVIRITTKAGATR